MVKFNVFFYYFEESGMSFFRFWRCRKWKCKNGENVSPDPPPTLYCLRLKKKKGDQNDQAFWGLGDDRFSLF